MKIRDVRFRDPVQVGGITAPGRVSWRREDGPCWFNGQYVVLPEDTFVPLSNVTWLRADAGPTPEQMAGPGPVVLVPGPDGKDVEMRLTKDVTEAGAPNTIFAPNLGGPAPGKGKKR